MDSPITRFPCALLGEARDQRPVGVSLLGYPERAIERGLGIARTGDSTGRNREGVLAITSSPAIVSVPGLPR